MGGRVVGLLLISQALRGLGYGIAAVQLGAILRLDGLTPARVGLMLAAILAGTLVAGLALARWGDLAGRRRTYAALYGALVCAGIIIAFGAPPWLPAVVAMTGALSVEVIESGPFTTLEQVMPAGTGRPQREVVRGFGLYNAVAVVAGTAGALLGALPADRRLLGEVLAVVGAAGVMLGTRLPASVEAPAAHPGLPRTRMLARSRGPGVLRSASLLAAPVVAARVGLLRTMVFTHIPSNLLLAAVPFAPALPGAIALLMARACLSQMDVPTRQAYVMALVPRTGADRGRGPHQHRPLPHPTGRTRAGRADPALRAGAPVRHRRSRQDRLRPDPVADLPIRPPARRPALPLMRST
ncbi:MFS transporter [Nonomuraea zeae]|uniref:MFS transporter n=1 Tax=Nonomuraea zeae TaxID=1642303 RepID=UPI00110A5A04